VAEPRIAGGKVLVLGSDDRSFLTVVRSLGRGGLEVHVGWCEPAAPALRSRYVHRHHDIPRYDPSDDGWKRKLLEVMDFERFDLVLPCHAEQVVPLQLNRMELSRHSRLWALDDETYQVVANKVRSYDLAHSLGLPVPPQAVVRDTAALAGLETRFGWPMIVKPRFSVYGSDLPSRARVRKAYDAKQLSGLVETMLRRDEAVVVQAYAPGRGLGVEVLCKEGRILVAFQHERIHEPPHGGGSSYRRSVPLEEHFHAATQKLMAALAYTGVAMVEYKRDTASADWSFMEINGRFWGSLPLAVASGVDFPLYLYQMIVEGRTEFPQSYRTNLFCRNLVADLGWYRQNRRADAADPTQHRVPIGQAVRELANLPLLRERSDTFVLDDWRPGFHQLVDLVKKVQHRIRRSVHTRVAGTSPLRRRSQTRVCSALRAGGTLLIVCKGNVCRSPYAQKVASRVLPNRIRIESCGYLPRGGRKSPPEAIRSARLRGIDLSENRSCVIDPEAAERADAIAIFDEANREHLMSRYPGVKKRLFYLGTFSPDRDVRIPDPWGGTAEDFDLVYDRIDSALAELAEQLRH
jgi:protein-tyrosine-phosphatase/predicted ATP-grasp superfamily ATP-dependent carboligase